MQHCAAPLFLTLLRMTYDREAVGETFNLKCPENFKRDLPRCAADTSRVLRNLSAVSCFRPASTRVPSDETLPPLMQMDSSLLRQERCGKEDVMLTLTSEMNRLLKLLREDNAASWVQAGSGRRKSWRNPGQQLAMRSTSADVQLNAPSIDRRVSCIQKHSHAGASV